MRSWLAMVVPLLAVAACGAAEPTATPGTTPPPAPAVVGPTQVAGTVDPMAIASFSCVQDTTGAWQVSGTVANTAKKARTYRVSVFIGEQTGPARVLDLAPLQPGKKAPFRLDPIVAGADGPCRLQALVKAD